MSINALNIAHRGGANLWPENTIEAFANAIEMGADGIEFDLQLTADKKLVLHHDNRLNADITRRDGAYLSKPTPYIRQLTLAQLSAYDVGRINPESALAKRRPTQQPIDGCRVQEFSVLCDMVLQDAKPSFRLYAELKTDMDNNVQAAEELADCFVAQIKDHAILPYITLVSFDWRCLSRVLKQLPDLQHAFTTLSFAETDPEHPSAHNDPPGSYVAMARRASAQGAPWWGDYDWRTQSGDSHGVRVLRAIAAAGGRGWFAEAQDINRETMALAIDLGLTVSAWTVNEADAMQKLAQAGVEAIITDRPDIMLNL